MNDQQLAHLSALTALNRMMAEGTFYISTVDDVAKTLGAIGDGRAHAILRPLHCTKMRDMAPELLDALPRLIERCIGVPAYQFQSTQTTPEGAARVKAATVRLLARD